LPLRPKPATDVYDRVLAVLEVAANEAVAIEDSPNGATAALKAGIACVGVPNTMTSLFDFPAGIKRVASLEGMSLDDLFALAKSGASGKL
jgi:putative hydrolase of the HAD superfamily